MIITAYLLLGSNLGNRAQVLEKATSSINSKLGSVVKASSIYETSAWGIEDQPPFLNQVIQIETQLTPHQLLTEINLIEKQLGRVRHEKWGERLIDIDILYYNTSIIHTRELKIPHPQIINRRFTLAPLAEVAPNYIHPMLEKTQQQLLAECKDELEVKKFTY